MISEYRVSIDRFLELKENVILPTMEKMKKELEQDGWYCLIGDLNPFDKFEIRKKNAGKIWLRFTVNSGYRKQNKPICFCFLRKRQSNNLRRYLESK